MNLHKCYATNNACYKAGKRIKVKGIMVHSTGANNPNLRRYVQPDDGLLGVNQNGNSYNTKYPGGKSVCVHAFIGKLKDGSIATYQTLPWDYRGWHAGGSANNTHISFEICEDGLKDADYFGKVYKEAVELCVYLCKMFGLTEKDIICHSEGYKKGVASNHADVMHWFPKHGKSMDTFRADVKAALNSAKPVPAEKSATTSTTKTCSVTLPVLSRGSTGTAVKRVQLILRELDYVGADGKLLKVDGSYGAGTEAAVKRYQAKRGFKNCDGIVGAQTWNRLLKG